MAFEPKPNTGSLFKNERKTTDSHPDYTGSALVDGVSYWQDAWINKDKNGKTYMSLKFKPKEAKADHQNERPAARKPARDDLDDSVPF